VKEGGIYLKMLMFLIISTAIISFSNYTGAQMETVQIKSSIDGASQPVIIQIPSNYNPEVPTPLLVGLHTWGGNYQQQVNPMGKEAEKRGWLLLLPDFRGPNKAANPDCKKACASKYAQQDIIDAIGYVYLHYNVDKKRIYLIGGSGGGFMSLMMASMYPEIWAAVSAWASITDLGKWREENKNYGIDIEACCGGVPGENEEIDREYFQRSPINFIEGAKEVWLDIHHGKNDKSVPYHHSEDAYKKLMQAGSKKVRFTLSDGGHVINIGEACDFVGSHHK
jgi:dipeptidyl aminopeptidase/acylaminoacyl peptidase